MEHNKSSGFSSELELLLSNVLIPILLINTDPGLRFFEMTKLNSYRDKNDKYRYTEMKDLLLRSRCLDLFNIIVQRFPHGVSSHLINEEEFSSHFRLPKALTNIMLEPRTEKEENILVKVLIDDLTKIDESTVHELKDIERYHHDALSGVPSAYCDLNSLYSMNLSFRNISIYTGTPIRQAHLLKKEFLEQSLSDLNDKERVQYFLEDPSYTSTATQKIGGSVRDIGEISENTIPSFDPLIAQKSIDQNKLNNIFNELQEKEDHNHEIKLMRLYSKSLSKGILNLLGYSSRRSSTSWLRSPRHISGDVDKYPIGRSYAQIITALPLTAIEQTILDGVLTLDHRRADYSSTMEKARLGCEMFVKLYSSPNTARGLLSHVYTNFSPRWDALETIMKWTKTVSRDKVRRKEIRFMKEFLWMSSGELGATLDYGSSRDEIKKSMLDLALAISNHIIGVDGVLMIVLSFIWAILRDKAWQADDNDIEIFKSCVDSTISLSSRALDVIGEAWGHDDKLYLETVFKHIKTVQRFFHGSSMQPYFGMTEGSQLHIIGGVIDHLYFMEQRLKSDGQTEPQDE